MIHSLRHTYGTRLGESGASAFRIMELMGHSSVTISQRYVHPSTDEKQRAVEAMEKWGRVGAVAEGKSGELAVSS